MATSIAKAKDNQHQGKDGTESGKSQSIDAATDKYTVDDVVQCVDEYSCKSRKKIFPQQATYAHFFHFFYVFYRSVHIMSYDTFIFPVRIQVLLPTG